MDVQRIVQMWETMPFPEEIKEDEGFARLREAYVDLLDVYAAHPFAASVPRVPAEEVQAQLRSGTPLLRGIEARVDFSHAESLLPSVAAWEGFSEEVRASLQEVLGRTSPEEREALLAAAWAGDGAAIHEMAERLEVQPKAFEAWLFFALYPTRVAVREAWLGKERVPLEAWGHGSCPFCGVLPHLGEFVGDRGERTLRCPSCGAAWEFPRLRCPACGEDDPNRLEALFFDVDRDKVRVDVCERCGHYVKGVPALELTDPYGLLLLDAFTYPLDVAAEEEGYGRPQAEERRES
ncbi:MAG: formate dehydrogenase accessory protein FdhE [Brockia lithotrophica]|uniref:Formate dehydrogenase accessory protein FdhE n=1 Tax=Brockia lithotrophica TaxID=933949 RepID=A0A2T5G4J0_9BACL|nr:MAG: formate dehydrogenase accessory protein FdhE [Brockia lithotrophica]